MFTRPVFEELLRRLREPRRFIQVLAGSRQVGKTTLAQQLIETVDLPSHYASADIPTLQSTVWLEQQWEAARLKISQGSRAVLLVLDEIQKLPDWSATVKYHWDKDTRRKYDIRVLLLGSSPLLMQRGLPESLAGRFEVVRLPHWSCAEMREAFGWTLDRFIFYGGYPGSAPLIGEPARWGRYVEESLIETTISRDILLMTHVDKPALLRQLFRLGCDLTGQVLSYQKMLGQLQDAGNTTTLAHYLDLLHGAGFLAGIPKFTGRRVLQRASSPKLIVLNNALATAQSGISFEEARRNREYWGRLVESVVGAYLLNNAPSAGARVHYWLDRNREVDFVVQSGDRLVAFEVKSGRARTSLPGMDAFRKQYPKSRLLLIGRDGLDLEDFLTSPVSRWIG